MCMRNFAKYQESLDLRNRHVALMTPFEAFLPKHHIMWHLIANIGLHGNPSWYSAWLDESLNKVLKSACRNVSQMTFEASVLLNMRELLAPALSAVPRRPQKRRRAS